MIDNYDSFVYNLVRYFEELGEEVLVFRNDAINIERIEELNIDGIILSPGPKSPEDAKLCLDIIDKFKGRIPILGVCLGHQCIGYYFGLDVKRANYPMHGKISVIEHNNTGLFKGIKNPLRVTRYHSLVVEMPTEESCLLLNSKSDDDAVMGISHKEYKIYGVQFHPEAELTEEGHKIIKNFIDIAKERK
ncbi:para-aminobenzoate synthetase component 2 [Clostridium cavendishii DSM 21758]|uniref:Para-aminobenzoate synthetase component 2 n=2 Tax=Clostridium TaxID=1485 RepID=A0A1M6EVF2_9CLOT|nr:para-aminobenzoate synthetase component 2 [Clostridium cavendishii DSM 21758]